MVAQHASIRDTIGAEGVHPIDNDVFHREINTMQADIPQDAWWKIIDAGCGFSFRKGSLGQGAFLGRQNLAEPMDSRSIGAEISWGRSSPSLSHKFNLDRMRRRESCSPARLEDEQKREARTDSRPACCTTVPTRINRCATAAGAQRGYAVPMHAGSPSRSREAEAEARQKTAL